MPSVSSRALLSTTASASIEGNVQYLLGKVQQTDVAVFDVREEALLLLPPSWLLVVVVVVRVLLQVTVHLKISFLSSCVPPAKVDGNEDEKELKEAPEDHAADDHRDERTDQPPGGVVDVVAANVLAAAELWGRKRNRNRNRNYLFSLYFINSSSTANVPVPPSRGYHRSSMHEQVAPAR